MNPALLALLAARTAPTASAISDTFSRADNPSSLGTTETGQAWEIISGTWGVTNGTMYKSAGSVGSRNHAVVDYGATDMRITAKTPVMGSGPAYPCIAGRFVDAGNAYFLQFAPNPSVVGRRVGGVNVTILSNLGTTVAGDTMSLSLREVAGSTVVTAYRNGVQIGTYTDTLAGRPMGTRGGIFSHSVYTDARFDDFTIEAP